MIRAVLGPRDDYFFEVLAHDSLQARMGEIFSTKPVLFSSVGIACEGKEQPVAACTVYFLMTYKPPRRVDGYLPLENYGLIGDGATAALIGHDGAVAWLCVPRFDSPPLFCSLLDAHKGGSFLVAPKELIETRQRYEDDTGVLVTEMRSSTGVLSVTDALTLRENANLTEDARAARGELLRVVRVLEGHVRLHVLIAPYGGARIKHVGGALQLCCHAHPKVELHLGGDLALDGAEGKYDLTQGDERFLVLRWGGGSLRGHTLHPKEQLDHTIGAWRRWISRFHYDGPQAALVRRSAITLKLLDHFENGAIVAAPTSSLPETIGGVRNWDYRFAWIRDAAFSVGALRRIGFHGEAAGFLAWVMQAIEGEERPCVLYDLDGKIPGPEREDDSLEGYRGSRPVRWGNAAIEQRQHDVYGEILDCAWQWSLGGGSIDPLLRDRLYQLVEAAHREWRNPDRSIWEVRSADRAFTYSVAACQIALDRGTRLFTRLGHTHPPPHWRRQAEEIRQTILEQAWDSRLNAIAMQLGGSGLDASVLTLPLRGVIPMDHPRMTATTEAIRTRLSAGNGLLYRYRTEELPDGLPGKEGAFLLCSFWLVENLVGQGRQEEACELFDRLCGYANPLGLLPEQIDPQTGEFRGNYPQALSHVGLISSAVCIAERATINAPEEREVAMDIIASGK